MLNKVNVTLLRQFLGLYCLSKLTLWLNHVAFFVSLLFRILRSLNHKHIPLFMLNKVNERLLRQFLGVYCLSKLTLGLNHVAFLVSLLFRILRSLNHIQIPLFMLRKVNVRLKASLRTFSGPLFSNIAPLTLYRTGGFYRFFVNFTTT